MEVCRNEDKGIKMHESLFVHYVWILKMNGKVWNWMFRVWIPENGLERYKLGWVRGIKFGDGRANPSNAVESSQHIL